MSEFIPTFSTELWLEAWRVHSSTGIHVHFTVDEDALEYFKGCTTADGKRAGQRFACVLVKLAADETPEKAPAVPPPKPEKPTTPEAEAALKAAELATFTKGKDGTYSRNLLAAEQAAGGGDADSGVPDGPKARAHFPEGLCGLAVRWCADEHFQSWLEDVFPTEWDATGSEEDYPHPEDRAKAVVCSVCRVKSRSELDTGGDAEDLFREKVLEPYSTRRKADEIDGPDDEKSASARAMDENDDPDDPF